MAYNLCPKMRRDFSKWILKAKKKGKNKSSQSGECKTENGSDKQIHAACAGLRMVRLGRESWEYLLKAYSPAHGK